eukprot:121665-Prymnesium_polylepis.1
MHTPLPVALVVCRDQLTLRGSPLPSRVTDPGLSRERRAKRPRMDETPAGVEAEDAEGRAVTCTSYGGQRVVARREPRTVAEQ